MNSQAVAQLEGMALLEWAWPNCRKCVTVWVGFDISSRLKPHPVHFFLPLDQDVEFSSPAHYVCLHDIMIHHDDNRLSL